MSLKAVPPSVRAHLYAYWTGLALAGAGVIGFFLSFWQVGSSTAAAVDVHQDVPVLAYASIAAWLLGLALMWYSRRKVDAAVAAKLKADREAMYVEFGLDPAEDTAPATASVAAPDTVEDTAPARREE